ncbi:MAG: CocE/NonD family hydrolase [Pseudomonadota bacterium]
MIFERNVEISLRDGAVLRANVFRPEGDHPVPVIMTHGPYGKDAHFEDAFKPQWDVLKDIYPGIDTEDTTGRYLRWEVVDPERWTPWGYAIVVVDSRGAGESPGTLWAWSPQEVLDYHDCIEWAGTQPWSNGKVGLLGISYYGSNQWQVAATRPPHLAAICPWEGFSDFYRDLTHHGGILSNHFVELWWSKQLLSIQHGNHQTPYRDRETGGLTVGEPLTPAQLRANRVEFPEEIRAHAFDGDWHAARTADLSRIEVPVLSAGNWGGMGLHLRGNVEGFLGAGSRQKWLELHGGTHFESFYLPRYMELQKAFFDHFLKGVDNGWERRPPVLLEVRHPDHFERREEAEWPLARTVWKPLYLDLAQGAMAEQAPAAAAHKTYAGLGPGVELTTPPMAAATELTGPMVAVLWVSSESDDMDLFVTVRAYGPDGAEVLFRGATDPAVPVAQGWLRVSHRATEAEKSAPWRPYHPHKAAEPMVPNEIYRVEVEIWPTSVVLPAGYLLALRIDGRDFEREGVDGPRKGSGPFLHTNAQDRQPAVFGARNTVYSGPGRESHLLVPLILASAVKATGMRAED